MLVFLGLAVSEGEIQHGLDGKPYTSLLYGNGNGFQGNGVDGTEPHTRQNLTSVDTGNTSIFTFQVRQKLFCCNIIIIGKVIKIKHIKINSYEI